MKRITIAKFGFEFEKIFMGKTVFDTPPLAESPA